MSRDGKGGSTITYYSRTNGHTPMPPAGVKVLSAKNGAATPFSGAPDGELSSSFFLIEQLKVRLALLPYRCNQWKAELLKGRLNSRIKI